MTGNSRDGADGRYNVHHDDHHDDRRPLSPQQLRDLAIARDALGQQRQPLQDPQEQQQLLQVKQ